MTVPHILRVELAGKSMSEVWRPTGWDSWRRQQSVLILIYHTLGREGVHRRTGQPSQNPHNNRHIVS